MNKNERASSAFEIRRIRPEDEPEIQNICHRTFTVCPDFPDPELVSYRWAAWYVRHAGDFSFAAVDGNGKAVGYVLCAPDTNEYTLSYETEMVPLIEERMQRLRISHPELYERFRLSFLPEAGEYSLPELRSVLREYPAHLHIDLLPGYQKRGLGGRLMEALLERLRGAGTAGVHLCVGTGNVNAVGFYRRFGFEILSTRMNGRRGFHIMGLKTSGRV